MQTPPDAVLRSLRPRRAIPATIGAPARKPIEALRNKLTHGRFTYRAALARGVQSTYLPELAPLRAAAHALIDDLSRERLAGASLEALAAFMCMAHRLDRDLPVAPAVAAARGVADLVEAARLALDLSVDSPGNWTQEIYLRKDATKASWVGEAWRPIRSAVCAASDADYAAARDRARTLGAGAAPWIAAHLAYAFPDEPWGDAALTAWLDATPDDPRRDVAFLLSCCREPALVRRLGGGVAPFTLALYAAEIAVSVPEADALALLGAAIPRRARQARLRPGPQDAAARAGDGADRLRERGRGADPRGLRGAPDPQRHRRWLLPGPPRAGGGADRRRQGQGAGQARARAGGR